MPLQPVRNRLAYSTQNPSVVSVAALAIGATLTVWTNIAGFQLIMHNILIRATVAGRYILRTAAGIPYAEYFIPANESRLFTFSPGGIAPTNNQSMVIENQSSAAADVSVTLYYELLDLV